MENGQPPREVEMPLTWFGCINVKNAVLVVNTILLASAALWITLMALYMAQHCLSSLCFPSNLKLMTHISSTSNGA